MLRWSDYVHVRGEGVSEFWRTASHGRRTLYILGEGFDPRMNVCLRRGLDTNSFESLSVLSLGLAPEGGTSVRALKARTNLEELSRLAAKNEVEHARIDFPAQVHERRSLPRFLVGAILEHRLFASAEHIVIDISALPVGIYFGLVKALLQMTDTGELVAELQVTVAENVEIDRRIAGMGVDPPASIQGFSFDADLDSGGKRSPVVWAPILGEGAAAQMEALADRLRPDEICPVLPFPAKNPRRADDLLVEMKLLLVDQLSVEPSNYIYADERNPFDLYRALSRLQERYRSALQPLGDAQVVLSLHSSKSLSLGALLAAYEHQLPAFNAEPDHYGFDDAGDPEALQRSDISGVWLAGTPTN